MTTPTPPDDDDRDAIAALITKHTGTHHGDVCGQHQAADAILADLKRRGRLRDEPSERERIAKWQAMAREAGAVVVDADWNVPAPAADGVTEKRANRIADWLRLNAVQLRDKAEQFNGLGAADWARAEADAMEEHASWIITAALAARKNP